MKICFLPTIFVPSKVLTNLIQYQNFLTNSKNNFYLQSSLAFSKVFDSVQKLFQKLQHIGIKGVFSGLNLTQITINNVQYNNGTNSILIQTGVPQTSVVAPLPFVIYKTVHNPSVLLKFAHLVMTQLLFSQTESSSQYLILHVQNSKRFRSGQTVSLHSTTTYN